MSEEKVMDEKGMISVTDDKTTDDKKIKKERKKGKAIYAHPVVKVFSFLGAIVSFCAVIACIAGIFYVGEKGLYRPGDSLERILDERFKVYAAMNVRQVISDLEYDESMADDFLSYRNIAGFILYSEDGKLEYSYYQEPYTKNNLPDKYVYSGVEKGHKWEVYLLPDLEKEYDAYKVDYIYFNYAYELRYWVIAGAFAFSILCLLFATLFVSGIGVSYRTGEVEEGIFSVIPYDVVTVVSLFLFLMGVPFINSGEGALELGTLIFWFILALAWVIGFIRRIKLKTIVKKSLIFIVLSFIWKMLMNVSMIWKTLIIFAIVSFCEFIFCMFILAASNDAMVFVLAVFGLFLEKCIAYPLILYFVYMTKCLFKAGDKLASGKVDSKVELKGLILDYKKHGENLNSLSDAVDKAVEEKMKSERMKTELITNVSHDLKTPLTSVINYSDLIRSEVSGFDSNTDAEESMGRIGEYSEVLNRQSNKLKRLLDDLVEISKANSGNIELYMEKLEIGTIISQALGEYEERLEASNLETVVSVPDTSLYVMADSRKIWRVIDNLMGNICKYAYPGTRVFIDAKEIDGNVQLVFKNTSRDEIKVSPDELLERFTRNDESRHLEGNGLGLAIAKTMTEVQGGKFKLEVDGDLFKVSLIFKKENGPEDKSVNGEYEVSTDIAATSANEEAFQNEFAMTAEESLTDEEASMNAEESFYDENAVMTEESPIEEES